MKVTGNTLLARALRQHGVDTMFFLMGGPTLGAGNACIEAGVRMIDVRHEQAACMMAQAYARLLSRPGICMAASGPGAINLTTGLANALIDCTPVLAIGGSSPVSQDMTGSFQEIDQVAIMRPVTKWAHRVYETHRIPEFVAMAYAQAMSGKMGPVYLDLPGDVLYREVEEDSVVWPRPWSERAVAKPAMSADTVETLAAMLRKAERPVLLTGSGILWSGAASALHELVDELGIPFYTTPQGRGVVPDDHPCSYMAARSTAFREADLVLVVGTRLNYVASYGRPPRFNPDAAFVRIDIDPAEIAVSPRLALGIVADAAVALRQIRVALQGDGMARRIAPWHARLQSATEARQRKAAAAPAESGAPIHPIRLCEEVRDFIDRDAVLVVDGQEILNFARQTIPTFVAGHRLNSGPFGTMGVGLPFGVGAKAAKPGSQVVVLHGDGSFGLNAMEVDTAVRHKLPILIVISLNGGWTGDPNRDKPGRDLGYTRFDRIAEALGAHGEFVEHADDIRPALDRAKEKVAQGLTAVVNVVTDWRARSVTTDFTNYTT